MRSGGCADVPEVRCRPRLTAGDSGPTVCVRAPGPPRLGSNDQQSVRGPMRGRGLKLGGRSPGGRDLLAGRVGERVGGDVELHRQFTVAEDLEPLALADGAGVDQLGDTDGATLREQLLQLGHVDDLVLDPEAVLEALELRQPHVDRHLAALERRRDLVAGLGALGATSGRLALGRLTATHAGLLGVRTRGRLQVMNLQVAHNQSTSSTVTRWVTVLTMPRISGRSSLTTVSCIRLSPRERNVSFWFCL